MPREIWFRSNSPDLDARVYSNFWPCQMPSGSRSAEHDYQSLKFLDPEHRRRCLAQPNALAALRYAQKWANGPRIRPDFDRVETMRLVLAQKFSIPYLRQRLLATGDATLIEDNPGFWGGRNGGENTLGKLLMELREELRA